jgi:hypothetical protein
MTATADLTLAEIAAKITDEDVSDYVAAMSALPAGVGTSEFFAKLLQGAFVAQAAKNALNTTAEAGELLDTYSAPVTGTVVTDLENNVQTFTAAYTINVVSSADNNVTVPAYI